MPIQHAATSRIMVGSVATPHRVRFQRILAYVRVAFAIAASDAIVVMMANANAVIAQVAIGDPWTQPDSFQ